jgi:hypothetical protein
MEGDDKDKLKSQTLSEFQNFIRDSDTADIARRTRGIVSLTWISHMKGRQYLDTLAKMEAVLASIGKRLAIVEAKGEENASKRLETTFAPKLD